MSMKYTVGSRPIQKDGEVPSRSPMPIGVTRTGEPCWLLEDDDDHTFRAKMSCGHVFCKYYLHYVLTNLITFLNIKQDLFYDPLLLIVCVYSI